ncbi:MAG: type II toxin-antitoxin system RelE/ParE family toxin [Caulobacteraceae bacterium]
MSGPDDLGRYVIWSSRSRRDLEAIRLYIGRDAPLAARRLSIQFFAAGESLATMPDRGRHVGGGVRELTIIYPYVIRYLV